MANRSRDERGAIAVWAATVIPAFVIIVGLGVDFAGHAAAEQSARAVAAEAARAGGQYLHAGPGSRPEPNTTMARQAARSYVEASDLVGTVTLEAGISTVDVTGQYETLFLGIMGVAVPGTQRPHSVPPGAHGGNIDLNLLTAGSALYLPVQVEGALAYLGDPHFAQGDGEVALTAMEASLRSRLRLDVIAREEAVAQFGEIAGPLAETAEHLVPTGMDEDLDRAVQDCVRHAIALLQARWGLDPEHAYAYLSAATDFDISQVVDVVKGVHARIRTADFAEVRR